MSTGTAEDRLDTFRSEWSTHIGSPTTRLQHRLILKKDMELILSKITQHRYDADALIDCVLDMEEELADVLTTHLEAASSVSIRELVDDIVDAVRIDNKTNFNPSDVADIIRNHLDEENMDKAIKDAGYDVNRVRSKLFDEIAGISRIESKKSLNLYDISDRIQECATELSSPSYQARYQAELADAIQEFLRNGSELVPIDEVIRELFGELQTNGWDEDSLEEALEVIESPDDIDEFCGLLRGEKYQREFCVPLPADRLPAPQMTVGGVNFYMEGCDDFTHLDDLIEADDRAGYPVNRLADDTNVFAVLDVVAPTLEIAKKRMQTKLERAIDALNYRKKVGVLRTPFTELQTKYYCKMPDESYKIQFINHKKYSIPLSFRFGDNAEVIEEWFEFMGSDESDLSPLQKRVISSYRWYGDGLQSGIPEEEFLKYMISIESMLVPEDSGGAKKYVIADRLSDLLGIYDEFRESFKDSMVALYDTRNKLIHDAEIDVPGLEDQVSTARERASDMFGTILESHMDDYDTVEELLTDVDELEVPERPDDWSPI